MGYRLIDGETEHTFWRSMRFWGGLLVASGIGRATSYAIRPPTSGTVSAEIIFSLLSPTVWVVMLVIESLLMLLGLSLKRITPVFVGAFFGMLFHLTFAYNLLVISLQREDSGWTGVIPLLVVSAVHGYIVWVIGPQIRRRIDQKGEGE